jgi:S-formylglutathione hydrolase FrmB
MGTSMTIVLPENRDMSDVNVVYLLHGMADNCTGWGRYTSVERYARKYEIALVIPEVQRSFYTNMKYGLKYFTFVHDELPQICKNFFGFSNKPNKTYVMGLSMGGYGALKCFFTTPERYAGCGAFSAVTDIISPEKEVTIQRSREKMAIFGSEIPESSNLFSILNSVKTKISPCYIACGEQDDLYFQSESIVEMLKAKGVATTFEHWEGTHNWDFWDRAVARCFEHFFGEGGI